MEKITDLQKYRERKDQEFNVDALNEEERSEFLRLSKLWRERGFG